jgi:hypothetical protein
MDCWACCLTCVVAWHLSHCCGDLLCVHRIVQVWPLWYWSQFVQYHFVPIPWFCVMIVFWCVIVGVCGERGVGVNSRMRDFLVGKFS